MKAFLVFLGGFTLAFGLNFVLGVIMPTPAPVFILACLTAALLYRIDKLKPVLGPLSATYSMVFLLLWFFSNERIPAGKMYNLVYLVAAMSLALGCLFCGTALLLRLAKNPLPVSVLKWMAILLLMGWGVAFFSGSTGGAGHMREFLMKLLGLSRHAVDILVPIARKSIHFFFYGSLGVVALKLAQKGGISGRNSVLWALSYVLTLAAFDEIRQSFASGRTSSPVDVMLDMAGALVLVTLFGGFTGAVHPSATKKPAAS